MLDAITKKQISKFVIEYLQKRVPNFQKKGDIFSCPFGSKHPDNVMTAHLNSPTSGKVHCYKCGELGDIFSLCRAIDFPGQELDDEDIADYLCQELGIKTDNKIVEWLEKYQKWGWSLVPVIKNGKDASIEKEWEKKEHKNISEWTDWISSGLNVGINGGKISNITVIDIDKKDLVGIPDIIKDQLNHTLVQDSPNGWHLFYFYEPELNSANLRKRSGFPIEVRNNGMQTVIYPSIVEGKERKFNDKEIIKMPEDIKNWFKQWNINEIVEDVKEKIQVNESDFTFEKLNGNRNNSFLQFGGILRKYYSIKDVERIMMLVNNGFIDKSLPQKEIKAMVRELGKYGSADTNLLQKQVTDYLLRHEEASARDLVECLKMERRDIQEVLAQLIQDNKIYKQKSLYKIIKDIDWKNTFINDIKILPYKVPYFDHVATFRDGDLIIIGGNPGTGKTHLAMNFVKKFSEQGLDNIYYYGTESKSRYLKIGMELSLKEGDYWWATGYEPSKIILKDNAITICDWLDIEDFTTTAQVYKLLQKQLDAHGGLLICFAQLNTNGTFYAENQSKFFAALMAKYQFSQTNGVLNTEITSLKIEKIRESKTGQQYFSIPTRFDPITKRVELR